ncbi:MAG TPA: MYXO-CTERM sorting domain-containing protein, partial [Polyangiales bacterium]|nr:MYXO-CTERM sorting domain-containing protein [Polyangiales bacterium]
PNGMFAPWTFILGAHTVNATAFDAPNGMGRPGEPLEIDFTLTRSVAPGAPAVGGSGAAGAVGVGARAGSPALANAGIGSIANPALSAAGTGAFDIPASVRGGEDATGCGCRVPGGTGEPTPAPGAWALATLAVGWLVRRRRRTRQR